MVQNTAECRINAQPRGVATLHWSCESVPDWKLMHNRVAFHAFREHASDSNHGRMQNQCAAARHLDDTLVMRISTRLEIDARHLGFELSIWPVDEAKQGYECAAAWCLDTSCLDVSPHARKRMHGCVASRIYARRSSQCPCRNECAAACPIASKRWL